MEWIYYKKHYSVSKDGTITRLTKSKFTDTSGKIRKPQKHNNGYSVISLSMDGKETRFYIHRLVALEYIPNPYNLPCVNHKNGIKTDNRVENLEWCTHSENKKHAYRIGITKAYDMRGENNPNWKGGITNR